MKKKKAIWKPKALGMALALLAAVGAAVAGPLKAENGRLVDKDGGDVVLRGFNLSQAHKKPPFRPNQDPALFTKLTSMGVNAVRLQFNWEAYESAPGVYDESYLDYYAGVVDRARIEGLRHRRHAPAASVAGHSTAAAKAFRSGPFPPAPRLLRNPTTALTASPGRSWPRCARPSSTGCSTLSSRRATWHGSTT